MDFWLIETELKKTTDNESLAQKTFLRPFFQANN